MKGADRTKAQLIEDNEALRRRVAELERAAGDEVIPGRDRPAEAVLGSEASFRALAENTPDVISRLDRQFRHLYANPAATPITGLAPEEFLGRTHRELGFPPEQCDHWERTIDRVFKTGRQVRDEFEYDAKTGRMTVDWLLTPEFGPDGTVVSVLSSVRDITERKRAEETVRDSRNLLQSVIDGTPDLIFMTDRQGRYQLANSATARALGRESPREVIGKADTEFLSPEEARQLREHDRGVLVSGETVVREETVGFTSVERVYQSVKSPFRDAEGEVAGVIGVARDITEQKQAAEALRVQAEIAKNMAAGVTIVRATDPTLLYANPRFEEMFGYEAGELIGKPVSVLNAPSDEDPEESADAILESLKQHGRWKGEVHNIRKDGTTFWCEASVSRFEHPEHGTVFVAVQGDITERRRTAERARFLSAITERVTDSIVVTDTDFKITYLNRPAEALYGYESAELVGLSPDLLNAEPMAGEIQQEIYRTMSSGGAHTGECLNRRKDGSTFMCEMRISPMLDEQGKLLAYVGVQRDVTERRQAEQALRESEEKYRRLFDTVPDAIMMFDAETKRFVDANEAALQLYGYTREEFLARSQSDITAQPGGSLAAIERTLARDLPRIPFHYHTKRDGTLFPVEISAGAFAMSGRQVLCGVMRDITERQQAEEDIEELARFPEENPNPVLRVEEDGTLQYANEAGRALLRSWGCAVGERLPHRWCKLVSGVFQQHSKRETEAAVGDRRFSLTFAPIADMGYVNVYGLDITARHQAEEGLRRSREELRALAARLTAAEEIERRRLAQELHDRVGQTLTALGLNLTIVQNQLSLESQARVGGRLKDAMALVEHTAERTRDVMADLRPSLLDDYGLLPALRWYGKTLSDRVGLPIVVDGDGGMRRLPQDAETILFRVAQEAVNNAVRHARASQVTITLEESPERVRLTIADDGQGFDPIPFIRQDVLGHPSWGLLGMRERIAAIGGEFHIETAPGQGTRVIVEIGSTE